MYFVGLFKSDFKKKWLWFHFLFADWEAQDPHVAFQTDPHSVRIQLGPISVGFSPGWEVIIICCKSDVCQGAGSCLGSIWWYLIPKNTSSNTEGSHCVLLPLHCRQGIFSALQIWGPDKCLRQQIFWQFHDKLKYSCLSFRMNSPMFSWKISFISSS